MLAKVYASHIVAILYIPTYIYTLLLLLQYNTFYSIGRDGDWVGLNLDLAIKDRPEPTSKYNKVTNQVSECT